MDLAGLGLRVIDEPLLLFLLGLELGLLGGKFGLDTLDLADDLGVRLRHAVRIVDAADEVLEARGVEEDRDE